MDKAFSLRKFYDRVILFLEDPDDDWAQSVVNFLHEYVFFSMLGLTLNKFRQVFVDEDEDDPENAEDGNTTNAEARAVRARREQRRKDKEEAEKAAAEASETARRLALEKEAEAVTQARLKQEGGERQSTQSSSDPASPSEPSSDSL